MSVRWELTKYVHTNLWDVAIKIIINIIDILKKWSQNAVKMAINKTAILF